MERAAEDIVRVKESVEESGVYSSRSYSTVIIEGIDQVVSTSRIETDLVDIAETGPSDENIAVFETTTAVDVPIVGLIELSRPGVLLSLLPLGLGDLFVHVVRDDFDSTFQFTRQNLMTYCY